MHAIVFLYPYRKTQLGKIKKKKMVTATAFHQLSNEWLLVFLGFHISYYLMGVGREPQCDFKSNQRQFATSCAK